jgi:hypothetical protein
MLKTSSLCVYSSNLGTFWLKIEQFWQIRKKGGRNLKKIFSSETTEAISTKLC